MCGEFKVTIVFIQKYPSPCGCFRPVHHSYAALTPAPRAFVVGSDRRPPNCKQWVVARNSAEDASAPHSQIPPSYRLNAPRTLPRSPNTLQHLSLSRTRHSERVRLVHISTDSHQQLHAAVIVPIQSSPHECCPAASISAACAPLPAPSSPPSHAPAAPELFAMFRSAPASVNSSCKELTILCSLHEC